MVHIKKKTLKNKQTRNKWVVWLKVMFVRYAEINETPQTARRAEVANPYAEYESIPTTLHDGRGPV